MKMKHLIALSVSLLTVCWLAVQLLWAAPAVNPRAAAKKAMEAGNFKNAFESFKKLALDPKDDLRQVGGDLNNAIVCLNNLGRTDEIDAIRDQVIKIHEKNWHLLVSAAASFNDYDHNGFIVAGKFYRGSNRGNDGRAVNALERDRVRGLQLLDQAIPLATADPDRAEAATFFLRFAQLLLADRGYAESWRLQYLTDLKDLPDYEDQWYGGSATQGAPVDEAGKPVFHSAVKRYADAKTDGQRWRWALNQAAEFDPKKLNEVRWQLADFLHDQFGVQTMQEFGLFLGRQAESNEDRAKNESGPYDLLGLKETETIARLASGIKRFDLPDEFNHIKIYQQIADEPKTGHGDDALQALAGIFENRRQYPRAAEFWRRAIKEYGPGGNKEKSQRLEQIVGNWGLFEPISTQPAGQGATVEFRYRNGKEVQFEAQEINVEKLLGDVKTYLKSKPNPQQLNYEKLNIQDIGNRLLQKNQAEYLGAKVANWKLDLKPRDGHFDRRVTVATTLQKAGAYMLTAKMTGGNTCKIVIWVADTVIVKKPLAENKTWYYVADAVTGQPIEKANLEFFGYRSRPTDERGTRWTIDTQNFAELTDADGQHLRPFKPNDEQYQWIITATKKDGRLAFLGFTNVWTGGGYDADYEQTKVFTITDRPVYRPGQKVKFKFWIRHAKYDLPDTSDFANQDFTVELHNAKGEKVLGKKFTSDTYGGLEGEYELPSDAALGVYQLMIVDHGGSSFRVEEYKKPEYEVTIDAPTVPVMLGEKVTATVKAKYYFGAPVVKAKVKYTVNRSNYSSQWYAPMPWDWLYGTGYWWFACDYPWYPGWKQWGCCRPIPWWWGGGPEGPPELVVERTVDIGADGTIKIDIDTGPAKALHPDDDHEYTVTAEVVDESRRTIVGTGKVLVARKPFRVFTWVDRGYYRVKDTISVNVAAHTLDKKPVQGKGKLTLFQISYKDGKPVEKSIREVDLDTDAQGMATLQIKASEAGQFRVSYSLTDDQKHTVDGGYLLTIIGDGFDGSEFRFNDLELISNKREFAPGESVNLQVNTNRSGGVVALFARAANGMYLPPKILRLKGKSAVEEIAVIKKDMPNFFVEALTVSGGKQYSEVKEIVVPPEKRVLNVEVKPSADHYKPGEKATATLKLTDFDGKPFVGSTVVAVYDKAVEYVSGGSNVPEIKEFFWKWRRSHNVNGESTLQRMFDNLTPDGQQMMQGIGAFGDNATEMDMKETERSAGEGGARHGGGARFNLGGATITAEAAPMQRKSAPGASRDAAKADGLAAPAAAEQAPQPAPGIEPTVRTKFADTALWVGSLTTDERGVADIKLEMPENLTTWKIKVWGMGHGTKVGQGEAEIVTKKDLIVRLQAPRFFVEKDEVVLSANVHNYLKTKKSVQVVLDLNSAIIKPLSDDGQPLKDDKTITRVSKTIEVAAGGEQRVDWRVQVLAEGQATVRMKALTDEESDAVEQKFPVFVHGMLKMDSFSGALRPSESVGALTINVPKERRIQQSRLEIRYSPTLAGAMVDALPYLAEYPYGCTEQTLNRFVPTVITQKILIDMGLDLKAIGEKRTNLNAQEIGDDKQRATQWKRFDRNPVFDPDEVKKMVKDGVQRLTEMQVSDGGWGWFSGYGERSYAHTTATVVHGLQIAQKNDVALVPGVLDRGVAWLKTYQEQQVKLLKHALAKPKPIEPYKDKADALDALVYMVLADAGQKNTDMLGYLDRDRVSLPVYAKALFGLALEKQGEKDKLAMVMENIKQYVVEDAENQTAYLKLPADNYWWHWYGSEIEAQAYYLKLLTKTDPRGELAPKLVKYLLNNRKHATYWNSTRDTSLVIEALAEFLKASGENKPELSVQVWIDGKQRKEVKITAADLFTFDNKFVLEGDGVEDGQHKIELKKTGTGPLYYNAYLTNFTLEDYIHRAGLEVKVNRAFYKLNKVDKSIKVAGSRGQAADQKVEKYERQELKDLSTLKSGDLVEVELEIDSKNDYEYILFEDFKAAGFEAVDVRSGYNGNSLAAYMELRDNRVSFFVHTLARGKHSVSYRLRAEIPGKFSALPATAAAMYAPELRGNSEELKLKIED